MGRVKPGVDFIVDEKLLPFLSKFDWYRSPGYNGPGYIFTSMKGKNISLHRFVICIFGEKHVDHINRDKSDNRLANLRYATHSQNCSNVVRKRRVNKYRGVCKAKKNWYIGIDHEGKAYRQYGFITEELAAMAYDELALHLKGEFAVLNFPKKERAK